MRTLPLNRKTAPSVIRFFDVCFKQGVLDAFNYRDDYGARDFVEKHTEAWDYGVLGEPDDFDWEMWRFTLYRWARGAGMKTFASDHLYQIVRKDYLWYILPFCMRFYLMGIREWIEHPSPVKLQLFKQEIKVHWKPTPDGQRKISTDDFISYMQQFTYEYRRSEISKRERPPINAKAMDAYCMAMHVLTRKYDTKQRIRIKDFEE